MEKKLQSNNPLVAVLATLIMAVGFLGYYAYDLKEQLGQEQAQQIAVRNEIEKTYLKFDSISKELTQKAEQIAQLGGQVDDLLEIKKQLENEKYQLRLAKSVTDEKHAELVAKISSYENLLSQKDLQISLLKENNSQLVAENKTQQDSIAQLKEKVKDLAAQTGSLSKKVKQVAFLVIEKLYVTATLSNGREKNGTEFKKNKIEKLKITFTIGQNPILESGTQHLYTRIVEPDGSILFDMAQNNHKIVINAKEEFYTFYKPILFDNTNQTVTQIFTKGNDFKLGLHKVELYHEGKMVAQTSFTVN